MSASDQITDTILMVRPAHFGFNEETAANNAFQRQDDRLDSREIARKALAEFDAFVSRLREAGIQVIVKEDTATPLKTDAVFPNNWVTFHAEGTVITYPMFSPNRRLERREEIIRQLSEKFLVAKRIHLEQTETEDRFLEGTGSMILDRTNKIVYACLSQRTDEQLLDEYCRITGYEKEVFHAVDQAGLPIYHTNVMMALGESFAVICMDTVKDARERESLAGRLEKTGKEIIGITMEQMLSFAGNMLQVKSREGKTFLVMSEQAYRSLTTAQIARIEAHTHILFSPLDTIEQYGGGSARCMMAEVFLPAK